MKIKVVNKSGMVEFRILPIGAIYNHNANNCEDLYIKLNDSGGCISLGGRITSTGLTSLCVQYVIEEISLRAL